MSVLAEIRRLWASSDLFFHGQPRRQPTTPPCRSVDYAGVEGKAESILFEEACLEQRTPGDGGVEGEGGQCEDDREGEDRAAGVPRGKIRGRRGTEPAPPLVKKSGDHREYAEADGDEENELLPAPS